MTCVGSHKLESTLSSNDSLMIDIMYLNLSTFFNILFERKIQAIVNYYMHTDSRALPFLRLPVMSPLNMIRCNHYTFKI